MAEYEEVMNQLNAARQETITVREQADKLRRESTTSTIRFELESQKREVARLNKIVESLSTELEKTKKENSEVGRFIKIKTVHWVGHKFYVRKLPPILVFSYPTCFN